MGEVEGNIIYALGLLEGNQGTVITFGWKEGVRHKGGFKWLDWTNKTNRANSQEGHKAGELD